MDLGSAECALPPEQPLHTGRQLSPLAAGHMANGS